MHEMGRCRVIGNTLRKLVYKVKFEMMENGERKAVVIDGTGRQRTVSAKDYDFGNKDRNWLSSILLFPKKI